MTGWLDNNRIEIFALELITPEYVDRIEERVKYLHNEYDKDSSLHLIDKIISELNKKLNEFSRIINREKITFPENPNLSPKENYALQMDIYKKMREGTYEFEKPNEEETIQLRNSLKLPIAHFVMYHIQGVKGQINWNGINNVIEQVKKTKTIIDSGKTINAISKLNDNYVEEIDSLETLMKGKLNLYVSILKKILEENNKFPIQDDGSWVKRRGDHSIIIAWIDSLEKSKKLKMSNLSNRQKAILLNKYFIGLSINENDTSLWRNAQTTYYNYKELFDKEIAKLNE